MPIVTSNGKWVGKRKRYGPGDVVEAITKAMGITPCQGCKKRKEVINTVAEKVVQKMEPK